MPVPPIGHSSSIDSASSFSSSKSSLLAPPLDEVSSQSDVADAANHSMPPGDSSVYGVAASPTHHSSSAFAASLSTPTTTQKLRRAFGKRRQHSQDAGSFLSSADERYASDSVTSPSSSHHLSSAVSSFSPSRPSAAKLTMHLFGARKHHEPSTPDPNQPPPLPPKPLGLRAPNPSTLQIPSSVAPILSSNAHGARPRNSVMVTSPSITAAIAFMREDEERQRVAEQEREHAENESRRELEENKENWRKSDSTMDSCHTVRPANNATDAAPGAANRRMSAYLATPPGGGQMDLLEFLAGAPEPEGPRPDTRPKDVSAGRQAKRRSLSLNIHVPSTHTATPSLSAPSVPSFMSSPYPTPPASTNLGLMHNAQSQGGHNLIVTSSPRETPSITRTPASGIITSGTASGSPVSKTNIRGRLAAWTATTGTGHRSPSPLSTTAASTSTPSLTNPSMTSLQSAPHRRVVVTSDASQRSAADLQAVAAVRQMQNRVRSPSGSSTSSSAGIRQAATSITNGAGARALGLGKRAYEKVGRVWGSSQSGSGSGSDTPSYRQPSPVNAFAVNALSGGALASQPFHNPTHGPSAFTPQGRRTPAASGTWSVSSMGGSRSSSEKDRAVNGPEFSNLATSPASREVGRLIRPPRNTMGGVVFGKDLWMCVKDTRAAVTGSARETLSGRMIPALVYRCAQHLHKWGLEEEGLFRISGRSSHISRLRNEFDGGADYDITECSPSELDPHAVASVFKAYLRELPEPVLTRALGPSFDAAVNAENSHSAPPTASGIVSKTLLGGGSGLPSGPRPVPTIRKPPSLSTFTLPTSSSLRSPSSTLIETLGDLIARLPQENRDLLQTVVELMNATAARSKETKMPLSNLLLVFCPSLSMAPTLLRVLCDVPSIWELRPPTVGIASTPRESDAEDTEESASDSDSGSQEVELVLLPTAFKGKEKEVPKASTELKVTTSGLTTRLADPQSEEAPVPRATSRSPRVIRRVPVPTLYLENQEMDGFQPYISRPFTPPLLADPPPHSGSSLSLDIPSRSRSPLSSPMRSDVSLDSTSDKHNVLPSPAQRHASPSPSPSSAFVPWLPPNHDKALPASPQSPIYPPVESPVKQEAKRHPSQPTDENRSNGSANQVDSGSTSQRHSPKEKRLEQSLAPSRKELNSDSAPQLPFLKDEHPVRSSSLPTTMVLGSRSAPNVAFPSSAKATPSTPSTPTSLKKHALTLSLGRSPRLPDDEGSPSPSKRLVRRPSLNLLFNLKRSGSPSPRSRTPTISSPLASPGYLDQVPQFSPTFPDPFPPVLTLPIESSMDVGLGWDDIFSSSGEVAPVPTHQPAAAISPLSAEPLRSQSVPSSSLGTTTEYPTSSDSLSHSNDRPSVLPSTTGVLEADSAPALPSSSAGSTSVVRPGDASSSSDRLMVDFPNEPPPMEEPISPPPHINFQLRRSSLEDEDWASIVLLAAGKPTESLA